MKIIERQRYSRKLIEYRDTQIIKVITGVRRCGKSCLLKYHIEYLKKQGVSEDRIIFINFEDYDNAELKDPDKLYAYIKARLDPNEMTYIFLDEIQQVKDFPRVVDGLYIKDNVDIYITGSNAYLLSSEIATLLSGRYVEIRMLPLSFSEYVASTGDSTELAKKYRNYIENSSFPYTLNLHDIEKTREYLDAVYNTIVIKDVSSRKNISDIMMLESVTRFVFDNIGNLLSTKKIADTMTSDGRKIDVKTVEKYIDALRESFVIYQAKRYNIKGKQYLKTLDKYYVVDIGLRNLLLGSRSADVGHILENVVYLELIRRGYDVYVGKVDDLEVDFVAYYLGKPCYIQVAATVRDEISLKRELAPLQKISDNYSKLILTLDDDPEADYDGIIRVNALDWLMAGR